MTNKNSILPPSIELGEDENGKIVHLEVTLPLLSRQDKGGYWIQCPVTKTIGFSTISFQEAEKDHKIDIDLFFQVHIKRNTLKSALTALGWKKNNKGYGNTSIPSYLLERATTSTKVYAY